ncbi:MAG: hypothetical protein WCQ20_07170 [Synechococcaceae cyanobacterium ELA739]
MNIFNAADVCRGMLSCHFSASKVKLDGYGPFNGQILRQCLVVSILNRIPFVAVVETGTFQGCTTEFISLLTSSPVHSIELSSRNYGFAIARLLGRPHCRLHLGSSEAVLPRILAQYSKSLKPLFFYLDAHWDDYLPLRDEIILIARACPNFIILIDDFEVPGDPGYHWDNYGDSGQLTFGYISDLVSQFGLHCWYPQMSSSQETGAKRGSILISSGSMAEAVQCLPGLRAHV